MKTLLKLSTSQSGILVLLALVSITAAQSRAANAAWSVDANGTWSTDANWSPAVAPGATNGNTSTDIATFGLALTANRTVTVDANRNIGGISFSNTSAFGYTLSGGSLLLTAGGVIQSLASGGAHNENVNTTVTLRDSATFANNATLSSHRMLFNNFVSGSSSAGETTILTLSGANTAANTLVTVVSDGINGGKLAIVKEGAGRWRFYGNNTFSGGVTLNDGILGFNQSAGAFGTGILTINGGTLEAAVATNNATYTNKITVGGNFAVRDASTDNWTSTFSGEVDLGGATRTITAELASGGGTSEFIFAGAISNGGLIKAGADSLTLSGINTYTGNTTVTAGTLTLASGSQTSFLIGADRVNNKILGTAGGSESINIDGTFLFDLTNAGNGVGNSWDIVDMVNFTPTYGQTFNVAGFTLDSLNNTQWTKDHEGYLYTFDQTTGILSVPEPSTYGMLALSGLAMGGYMIRKRRRRIGLTP